MHAYLEDMGRVRAASSVRIYKSHLRTFVAWLDFEDRAELGELSRALLAEYWAYLHKRGAAVVSANRMVQRVMHWWAWAHDHDEYGDHTPRARRIELRRLPPSAPTEAPTWAQMDAAISHAHADWHRRLLVLMRCTGLRVGQARQLLWSDVDLDEGRLTVRPELGKTHAERAGRTVPLAPVLVQEMAGWGVRHGPIVAEHSEDWCRLLTRAAWNAAEVPPSLWERRPHHAFRKGFRSELHAAGADVHAAEHLLGHDQGILGVYVDPRTLSLVEAVALVRPISAAPSLPPQGRLQLAGGEE